MIMWSSGVLRKLPRQETKRRPDLGHKNASKNVCTRDFHTTRMALVVAITGGARGIGKVSLLTPEAFWSTHSYCQCGDDVFLSRLLSFGALTFKLRQTSFFRFNSKSTFC